MQVLLDHCHDMGIDFHAMFRLGIIGDILPSDLWENSTPHYVVMPSICRENIPPADLWENSMGIVRRRPDL